jgi:cysteine desulfurase family protein (TIGR01976 family)
MPIIPSQALDVAPTEAIRPHFPALARRHRGREVAYFDGPGGTQVPLAVVEAMADYLLHHNANTHWNYPTSHETDAAIADARAALADFLGAEPAEVAFGANMTTLTYHLSRSLGRGMGPGDEIVVTELDHHANVDPWRALEVERGVTIKVVRMRVEDGRLDMDDLARQVGPRTKLLAIGAASNALGTINDVRAAAAIARDAGAAVFVDAVHYAPHAPMDVKALGCDFLACSAYKFYGPHIGVLYGRRDRLEALDVPKLRPASDEAPERFETGTLSHEGIVGAGATVDYLASLAAGPTRRARLEAALAAFHARASGMLTRLWEGLEVIDGVRLFGPPPSSPRTATLSFVVAGVPSAEVARRLASRAVFVSNGDFYATTAVARLGHADDGLVRAGCALYTTDDEIDRLVEGVRAIARGGE